MFCAFIGVLRLHGCFTPLLVFYAVLSNISLTWRRPTYNVGRKPEQPQWETHDPPQAAADLLAQNRRGSHLSWEAPGSLRCDRAITDWATEGPSIQTAYHARMSVFTTPSTRMWISCNFIYQDVKQPAYTHCKASSTPHNLSCGICPVGRCGLYACIIHDLLLMTFRSWIC